VLKSIKDGAELGGAYGATLERIKAQDEEKARMAMAALTWVCHSERPLQVDELCYALAVEIGETDFDHENIPWMGTLLDCCQGLIAVDAEASTVRLIHYTVQEYLSTQSGLFSKPHSILAETCLTYLNSQQLKNLTPHSLPDNRSTPFLKYSSRYWGIHTNRDPSVNVRALALRLLDQYEDHISAVSLLEQVPHPGDIGGIPTSPLFSGLHCASFFGIVEFVTILLKDEGYKINQQDCTGSTPLAWAARNGHQGVVKILLEQSNVDPNFPDAYDRTPLGCAAIQGHEGIVRLLLEGENVDPNRQDKDGHGPLGSAAICGHDGVVRLLLERADINPNCPGSYGRTPLGNAAIYGHEVVVKLLLERGDVDPNWVDFGGLTPLEWAAFKGHEGVVKLFLERGDVDPNRPDKNGLTPLWLSTVLGHEGVVKLLLEREDVDPDRSNIRGRTPLSYAASMGHEGIAQLLGARKSVETPDAGTKTEGG